MTWLDRNYDGDLPPLKTNMLDLQTYRLKKSGYLNVRCSKKKIIFMIFQ